VQQRSDRRERKKRAVKEALEAAALQLFDKNGFTETTVDEIADEADVSRSTFFRYFGSKEAVLFGSVDENGEVLSQLILKRPATESPMVAFENALVEFAAVPGIARQPADADRLRRILEAHPALQTKVAQLTHNWQTRLAGTLADRDGESRPGQRHALTAAVGIVISERLRDEYVSPSYSGDLESTIRNQFRLLRELVRDDSV
jgi:AcrR family transcriptional regulator